MMKSVFLLLLLVTPFAVRAQNATEVERAQQMVQWMVDGDYDAVYAQFNDDLKAAYAQGEFNHVWEGVTGAVGEYVGMISVAEDTAIYHLAEAHRVTITLQFQKMPANAVIIFDSAGLVGALNFLAVNGPQPTLAVAVQPAVQAGLYRVAYVPEYEVLPVRSDAGPHYRPVGALTFDARDVAITGTGVQNGDVLWVPVQQGNVTGWVDRYYLTEDVSSADFCADPAVSQLIADFKSAVAARDGTQLGALVAPERGLWVNLTPDSRDTLLMLSEVEALFSDPTIRDWDIINDVEGTAAEIIVPVLERTLLPYDVAACDQLIVGETRGVLSIQNDYHAVHFLSIHRPAPNGEDASQWETLVVGIEYWNGQPHLSYVMGFVPYRV